MISLYNDTCQEISKLITNNYSTSFSLGIRDRKLLLEEFKRDTYQAIERKISLNPVLHAFQEVVHEYGLELEHIEAFLKSMEMDLS